MCRQSRVFWEKVTRQKFWQLSSKPYELLLFLSSGKTSEKNKRKCQQQSNTSKRKRPRASTRASAASSSNTRVTSFSITRIGINGGRLRVRRKDVSLFWRSVQNFRSLIFSSSLNFLSLTERNQNQRHFVVSAFDWSLRRVYSSGFWLFFFSRLVGRFLSF